MKALDIAESMGVDADAAEAYIKSCDEVIEGEEFVAMRQGNKVHLAIRVRGLGGRRVLNRCREVLAGWLKVTPFLLAPVKHGNDAAISVAEALGFSRYAKTSTHVWLARESDHE